MEFNLFFAGEEHRVSIPDSCQVDVIEPKTVKRDKSNEALLQSALHSPINADNFAEFTSNHDSFLLIVNDHARATPTPLILKKVLPYLEGKPFKIIVASGTHVQPSEQLLKERIIGENYEQLKERVVLHDAKESEFVTLGKTRRETPLKFNKIITEFEALIPINSIEPHYFAGFTGGRKSFFPGIAAYDAVEANHSMALKDSAKILSLQGNPLHEDLEEAAKKVVQEYPVFAINLVLDGEGKIVQAFAGDIIKQLYTGAKLAKKIYAPKIEEKADVVLSIVHPPLDKNLYQAQKGLENCKYTVKDGGIFILVAACKKGIGPEDYASMLQSGESIEDLHDHFSRVKENYQLGWHKVGSIPQILQKMDFWMVTNLENETAKKIHVKPFSSIQEAMDKILEQKGKGCKILIVRDAANIAPMPKK